MSHSISNNSIPIIDQCMGFNKESIKVNFRIERTGWFESRKITYMNQNCTVQEMITGLQKKMLGETKPQTVNQLKELLAAVSEFEKEHRDFIATVHHFFSRGPTLQDLYTEIQNTELRITQTNIDEIHQEPEKPDNPYQRELDRHRSIHDKQIANLQAQLEDMTENQPGYADKKKMLNRIIDLKKAGEENIIKRAKLFNIDPQ